MQTYPFRPAEFRTDNRKLRFLEPERGASPLAFI